MARRIDQILIAAQTNINSQGVLDISEAAQLHEVAFYVDFDHTSSAGTVLIETAADASYTGTWGVLATVNWAAIDKSHYVAITGVFRVIRARISVAITNGTVTVRMIGNKD
jgi:hypothetical protein